jgi:AcrR family transcriptional regulator
VGNREALLDAATLCIFEKGYSRTTARDVASTAGTSLAAIGYHFGSMDKLMAAAMINGLSTWGDASDEALADVSGAGQSRAARFDAFWTHLIEGMPEQRPMWVASFEAFTMIERMPELRGHIAEAMGQVRTDFAEQFGRPEDAADEDGAHAIGSVVYALMVGVLTQWLVDPDAAPSAAELQTGLRGLLAGLDDRPTSS